MWRYTVKKQNSSDQAYDWQQLMLALVNPEAVNATSGAPSSELPDPKAPYSMSRFFDSIKKEIEALEKEASNYEEDLWEWEGMLAYFLDTGNAEEASFCRRMMQQARVAKRRLKAEIKELRNRERTYSEKYVNGLDLVERRIAPV